MIADEVMSGFGRTGEWFAVDHWEVIPDIITMAKGLTSAYAPLGAVAMKPEISACFDKVVFNSGLTYTAHPVSLAAALANINVIQEDKIIENSKMMGLILKKLLEDLFDEHESVGDIRSIGLFAALELVKSRDTNEPMSPFNTTNKEMNKFREFCLDNGLFLYTHWNTVLIIPPLIINEKQLNEGFKILDEALSIIDKACIN